jgi:hypothetical protein
MSQMGQKRLTCSTVVCLLSPAADMARFGPGPIFAPAEEPRNLGSPAPPVPPTLIYLSAKLAELPLNSRPSRM